jgi:hypothetical protein
MFREMDIKDIQNYEIVFNVQKNKLDEFEGKIREIEQISDTESKENLLQPSKIKTNLDEGEIIWTF